MKRIKYNTMNSWNLSTSLAYDLKVYNVIPKKYQERVYELMQYDNFYNEINWLMSDFDRENDYKFQAGFNGRSGGYLVLYQGGKNEDGTVYTKPGLGLEVNDVPVHVRKAFRKLANDIVALTIDMAKYATIETETISKEHKYIAY